MLPRIKVIVVAEDEWLVRITAVDVLTQAGFEVLEAGHHGALRLLKAQADGVHALFTDIHMPGGMNGLQLAHHARKNWPWIASLIVSGRQDLTWTTFRRAADSWPNRMSRPMS